MEGEINTEIIKEKRSNTSQVWSIPNVKLTYLKGHNNDNYINFSNLVDKNSLKTAFLSTTHFSYPWILNYISQLTKIFVFRPRPKHLNKKTRYMIKNNVFYLFPPYEVEEALNYSFMNIRLMLLWYPKYMRVVVTSANLIPEDWENNENDFPYINGDFHNSTYKNNTISYFQDSNFGNDLLEFLFVAAVPKSLIELVKRVDFSIASGRLIFSIPGVHMDKKGPSWGLRRLARIIEPWKKEFENFLKKSTLNKESIPKLRPSIIYQTVHSSHTPQWIKEIFYSSLGEEYSDKYGINQRSYNWSNGYKIIQKTISGSSNTETQITLSNNTSCLIHSPYHILNSKRPSTTSHIRLIICFFDRFKETPISMDIPDTELRAYIPGKIFPHKYKISGWFYCGSHDSSNRDWGQSIRRFVIKGNNKSTNLYGGRYQISNWQAGVIFPLISISKDSILESPMEVASSLVQPPIPFIMPLIKHKFPTCCST